VSPTTYPELEEEVQTSPTTERSSQPQVHLQAGDVSVETKARQHEPEPQEGQHTARLKSKKERAAYISPSAQGTVSVIVRLDPEVKEAVDKIVDETGVTQKEFLTAAIKRAIQGHTAEADPVTAKMTEEALEKTHELEFLLRRVNRSLSTRSR